MDPLLLKFLHVTGTCLFIGNNLVTHWRLARIWYVAGTAASLLPLVSLYLMVTKP